MRILVLNGPNLNLLGQREPDIYGSTTLDEIVKKITDRGKDLGVEVEAIQSNDEGALVTSVQKSIGRYDGIILNPAAYTHTSVALCDAIKAVPTPCVEVHLSNIYAREEYRHASLTAGACIGQISGFGDRSYVLALDAIVEYLRNRKSKEN
ncbi:MAG: type II 3-dehydroquinate dehydratase [Lentisphaerae bacterium]|nr:type II 3-dehydroquinate dehydratase [Lentisphaerota bacterium]